MRKENVALKQKMYGLLDKYKSSGLSQNKFCEFHGVSVSVLKYWRRKFTIEMASDVDGTKSESLVGFVDVEVSSDRLANKASKDLLQLHFPNGVRVECPSDISTERLEGIIRIY